MVEMFVGETSKKFNYTGRHMSNSIQVEQYVSDTNRSAPLGYSFPSAGEYFTRYLMLPKAEKYPLEVFSYTSLDFNSFKEKYPHFSEQLSILAELKNLISEFNKNSEKGDLKWLSLCLDRSNGKKTPRIQLDFYCKKEELFEKVQEAIDAIINN